MKDATEEQAADVIVLPQGVGVWWPQVDDGLYLPAFLERRWGKPRQKPYRIEKQVVAA